jgi:hypothetical protein
MEELTKVWNYLIAIGFLPLAIVMSLAAYGLARWYYGINDFFLKAVAITTDTPENIQKSKDLNNALKVIKALPIIVGMIVTIAMQAKEGNRFADYVISACLGIAHAFMAVTLYETLIEFKIFKQIEAKFITTKEQ